MAAPDGAGSASGAAAADGADFAGMLLPFVPEPAGLPFLDADVQFAASGPDYSFVVAVGRNGLLCPLVPIHNTGDTVLVAWPGFLGAQHGGPAVPAEAREANMDDPATPEVGALLRVLIEEVPLAAASEWLVLEALPE